MFLAPGIRLLSALLHAPNEDGLPALYRRRSEEGRGSGDSGGCRGGRKLWGQRGEPCKGALERDACRDGHVGSAAERTQLEGALERDARRDGDDGRGLDIKPGQTERCGLAQGHVIERDSRRGTVHSEARLDGVEVEVKTIGVLLIDDF